MPTQENSWSGKQTELFWEKRSQSGSDRFWSALISVLLCKKGSGEIFKVVGFRLDIRCCHFEKTAWDLPAFLIFPDAWRAAFVMIDRMKRTGGVCAQTVGSGILHDDPFSEKYMQ